ncbi:hypothetical protein PLESTB_001556000 [Pleodorina starrii]|uniref:SMP-LTD domain-containing protein n=1 Tax=Pleodorina starrii TaxID=330485 RepID=A0A9W6F875_9CHLO|nr:hypothetical protein PLESTB_001556000 [Pleodorina starrii]
MAAPEGRLVPAEVQRTADGAITEETTVAAARHNSIGRDATAYGAGRACSDAVGSQLEQASSPLIGSTSHQTAQIGAMPHSVEASFCSVAGQQHIACDEITEVCTPKAAPPPSSAATPSTVPLPDMPPDKGPGVATPLEGATAIPVSTVGAAKKGPVSPTRIAEGESSFPQENGVGPKGADVGAPTIAPAEATEASPMKALPQVAVDAAKQAGQAYVEAGKEARTTVNSLATAFMSKSGPPITLTVDHIATVLFFVILGFNLLILPIFLPSLFRLAYCLVWGLLFGLGLSFLFYYNKKAKTERNDLLSVNLGVKGMYLVSGGLPSWFNMSQSEKLEWLNQLIMEIWPFVDKGVCDMIKEMTAQVMPGVLKTLPAGMGGIVKSIGFKHLTFGDAPFRVESMWVSRDEKESLVMELSVKWCGDPNITLAIEIPGGQKLCPRVMDITFVAQVRVVLNPLVARIPGFVALMATVPKPPLIKYRLDFGKAMGGSMAPAAVTPVINYFLRDVINKMLVWPQRLVVPVIQETEQDKVEIQKLMRRHRGVVRVCVMGARELKPDSWGNNDVLVELTTDSEHYEATSIKRAKPVLGPDGKVIEHLGETVVWNEYIYLLIQEPKDQLMLLEMFDIDRLRPTKLLTGQVSQVINGRQLVGRSLLKLAEVCREGTSGSGEPVGMISHLGKGEWGSPGGPGKGLGKVRLQLQYWPFEKFTKHDVENAMTGIVTVRLLKVWGLAVAGDRVSAFVRVTSSAARSKEWKSTTRTWTRRNHILMLKREMTRLAAARERDMREGRSKEAERKARYLEALKDAVAGNNKRARLTVEMDYTLTDVIKIKVIESSLLSSAECLGRLDVPVSDIVTANDFNPMTGQREYGLHRKRWEEYNPENPDRTLDHLERGLLLEEGDGARIWVEMRWVPCIQAMGLPADEADDAAAPATPLPDSSVTSSRRSTVAGLS